MTKRKPKDPLSADPGRGLAKVRESAIGPEKFCTSCQEWWPADEEFFFSDSSNRTGLFYQCKACYRSWQATTPTKCRRPRASDSVAPPPDLAMVPWLGSAVPVTGATLP